MTFFSSHWYRASQSLTGCRSLTRLLQRLTGVRAPTYVEDELRTKAKAEYEAALRLKFSGFR
jgi:hypothetical protein